MQLTRMMGTFGMLFGIDDVAEYSLQVQRQRGAFDVAIGVWHEIAGLLICLLSCHLTDGKYIWLDTDKSLTEQVRVRCVFAFVTSAHSHPHQCTLFSSRALVARASLSCEKSTLSRTRSSTCTDRRHCTCCTWRYADLKYQRVCVFFFLFSLLVTFFPTTVQVRHRQRSVPDHARAGAHVRRVAAADQGQGL